MYVIIGLAWVSRASERAKRREGVLAISLACYQLLVLLGRLADDFDIKLFL